MGRQLVPHPVGYLGAVRCGAGSRPGPFGSTLFQLLSPFTAGTPEGAASRSRAYRHRRGGIVLPRWTR
jgi:hypothetical protein